MFPVAFLVFFGRKSVGGFFLQNPPTRPSTHRAFFLHSKLLLHRGKVQRIDGSRRRLAPIWRQQEVCLIFVRLGPRLVLCSYRTIRYHFRLRSS